ncbi:MAG: aminotransferase class V-fold PLP-dependent enzyme [Polyangiales bacterium]
MSARVYLDHHASAPLCAAARDAMMRALDAGHGNPSSLHREGRRSRDALEHARGQVAESLGCAARELVFTSGGTEALHLAVLGVGEAQGARAVLCDPGAHPALRAACESLATRLRVPFEFLPARAGAAVYDPARVTEGALVAISWVQHETGRHADDASALIAAANACGATVVIDAVQAFGKVPLAPRALGAAAVALSAHKIGGPQGVGALWMTPGQRAHATLRGGGQERGLRAGTEPVLAAVGFGAAAGTLAERLASQPRIAALRDRAERAIVATGDASPSVDGGARVATVTHVALRGCDGAELVASFDLEGVALSSRAACSSGRSEPSESLLRLFADAPWRASGALRVSLGPETTDADLAHFEAVAPVVIARVRAAQRSTKR